MTASVIAMISESLWVMRMTVTPFCFITRRILKTFRLARCQHTGGFIEDEDPAHPLPP